MGVREWRYIPGFEMEPGPEDSVPVRGLGTCPC